MLSLYFCAVFNHPDVIRRVDERNRVKITRYSSTSPSIETFQSVLTPSADERILDNAPSGIFTLWLKLPADSSVDALFCSSESDRN
jgi:hypothetical protein